MSLSFQGKGNYCFQVMYNIKQKHKVELKTTAIYEMFDQILSSNNAEVREYLFDWLGHITQHPDRKWGGGRIFILRNVRQGCGKSSFFYFLRHLLGEHNCVMIGTLKDLLHDFSIHLSSKLVIFIDDIDQSTSKETGKLKQRITSMQTFYCEKNKTPIMLSPYTA